MQSDDDEMVSYRGASRITGLKVQTLYSKVSRREVPFYRLGRRLVVFSVEELHEWLRQRRVEATR